MKRLTIYDKDIVQPFLDIADYEGCNSNFTTMMMWNHVYHIQYEIHEHFMVMLNEYKGHYAWAMPFCKKEYYKEAIEYMIEYSYKHQIEFVIECAIQSFKDDLKSIFGSSLIYERTRHNDDYIYDKNMLMTLSGKKMQKRRNHYNAFCKQYPCYEYRDLDLVNDFSDVIHCLSKWNTDKDDSSESMIAEVFGVLMLLSADILNIKAGAIYIENKMEAFIIASKINHSTVQIHVEKANKHIRGLYPAILKELLEHHYKDELYVNREDDMGLENLRKAKLSLHPIYMIEKYRIYKNQTYITNALEEEKAIIKEIWLNKFNDENEESANFYFNETYKKENMFLLKNKDIIISGCQIIPFKLMFKDKCEEVYFILGVFTMNNFEGQGFMKYLLNTVLSYPKYKDKKIYLQAYNPDIYKSLNFLPSHYHYKTDVNKDYYRQYSIDNISQDFSNLKYIYDNFVLKYDEYRVRDEQYFNWLIKRCESFNETIYVYTYLDQLDGYMIYHTNDNHVYVSEFIYLNEDAKNRMIATLCQQFDKVIIESDLNTYIEGNKEKTITMLSNYRYHVDNKYINEIY